MNTAEKQDFLKYFGAVHVRVLSNFGRMKHAAFATFREQSAAAQALARLHQLKVLGHTLVVEYAKSKAASQAGLAPNSNNERRNGEAIDTSIDNCNLEQECKTEKAAYRNPTVADGMDQGIGISSRHGIDFPLNPVLRYRYPAPTVSILTNIVNSLASVPRFYTQVLHLMNKMNLPGPFGPVTPAPPLIRDVPAPSVVSNQTVEAMDLSSSSEEESEIESDPEERAKMQTTQPSLKRPGKTKNPQRAKRHKLQPLVPTKVPPVGGAVAPSHPAKAVDVFEQSQAPIGKRIEFRLTEGITGALDGNPMHSTRVPGEETAGSGELRTDIPTAEANRGSSSLVSGFGTFEHPTMEKKATLAQRDGLEEEEMENDEDEDDGKVTEFISRRELRNRLPDHEIKRHPVFKRYEPGEATTRLYLKNLAKTVEEKDLKYIYGRYVEWSSPIDRDMFTIQLMTQGRMKGQAFVGLPSEFAAQKALRDTNAYILQGKPIVVQFARSAKLKEKEEKEPKKKGRREI